MKTYRLFIFPALFLNIQISYSQNFTPDLSIPVTVNGITLNNAWAGGIDIPQFSAIDLNGDGVKDLFVFEPFLNRVTTYVNYGTPNQVDYHYAPQYIAKFPKMHNWSVLEDYNCDGNEDIFTYSYYGGATLYKNVSSAGNLQFLLKDTLLFTTYFGFPANLFIKSNDLASFTDVDADGDMDVLTLSVTNSGLEFHKNYAMENFGVCDTLIFMLDTAGWGSITLTGGSNESDNFLAFDNDGDGDNDILTNDAASGLPNYNNLLYYENTGNALSPNLVLADDSFPSYNIFAHVRNFPAAFYLDANNDGEKDLIVSPQQNNSSENVHNAYFYEDTSATPVNSFKIIEDNFLGGGMIDIGSGANVRFFDVDNDGLQDIIIGNYQKREKNGNDITSLWYFRNTGTGTNPAFEFVNNNFANSMTNTQFGMAPAFGDIDGDGDEDMLVGLSDGSLSLYTNTAGNFVFTSNNYQAIDVGNYCAPYLFDINQDGLIDLICGNKLGKLSYYENTGSTTIPVFTLINSFLGQVTVVDSLNDIYGYSYPFLYMKNSSLELLVGSLKGNIFRYGNITGNLNGVFTLLDTLYGGINEPKYVTVDGTDINGDGLMDLLTGNYAGGATLYKQLPVPVNEIANGQVKFNIFPNPVSTTLSIILNGNNNTVTITNLPGQILMEKNFSKGNIEIDVTFLSSGIYFIKVGSEVRKFVKE